MVAKASVADLSQRRLRDCLGSRFHIFASTAPAFGVAIMKNPFIAGGAAACLAVGGAGSANAANPNVPLFSPYALMNVDPDENRQSGYNRQPAHGMAEGHAPYVHGGLSIAPARRSYLSSHAGHTQLSLSELGVTASFGYGDDTGMR
jgi:hypothetical protein